MVRGTYITAVCRPYLTFGFSHASKIVGPGSTAIKKLKLMHCSSKIHYFPQVEDYKKGEFIGTNCIVCRNKFCYRRESKYPASFCHSTCQHVLHCQPVPLYKHKVIGCHENCVCCWAVCSRNGIWIRQYAGGYIEFFHWTCYSLGLVHWFKFSLWYYCWNQYNI